MLRSKAAFGEDITKRVNEPARERFNFTLPASDSALRLPAHLAAPAAIGPETAPYEEAIIDYIISTHDEQEFPGACRKKMKNVKNRRRFVVERIYKVYMAYRLRRKTLYLAVYYFDKFMRLAEEKDFEKQKLIGESCLLIAMKYEEIYPPLLSTWASGKVKQLIDLEFKKCPFTNENSICVEPRLDDNGDFMGLKSMALDLNCVEMPSGGSGYKKDNSEHNKMLGLKLNLGEFGCKITRTDANGKKLTTHAHHESHVYYIRHTAFVPGNWEIVKNIVKKS